MDTLASLQSLFSTLWVVWFFVLFTGVLVYVLAPWRKRELEAHSSIPFRDEDTQRHLS
jgi:cytochrome c oxidase cbb3-type subunit 4